MSRDVVEGLRSWARGSYAEEAAVELLVRSFGGRFAAAGCPWIAGCDRPGWFWIDASAIHEFGGGLSGGEWRVLSIVAALVDNRSVDDLGGIMAGVDRRHLGLILAALSHAGGSHQHSDIVIHDEGDSCHFVRLPALVDWPAERIEAAA